MGMGKLFLPIRIKNREVRNRVVLPPIVRFGWAGDDGRVTGQHVAHYRECAEGGAGLVIAEATCVTAKGRSFPGQLGLWEDGQIPGYARIGEAVRQAGSTVLVQLYHGGYTSVHGDAVCPSDWHDGKRQARAMTPEELGAIQDAFVAAAHRARKAGMDGVELHAAHGFLLNQFASPDVNRREDAYGGSIENRARFTGEIIARIKKQMPEDFILSVRMGGNEPTVDEGIELAGLYQDAGADVLDISTGLGPEPDVPEDFDFDPRVWLASRIRGHVHVPVIAVGGLDEDQKAEAVIEQGYADMAAIARGFLADSHWGIKMQQEIKAASCRRCRPCRWFKKADNCPKPDKK
jgi:NADPH2 dehydrogenase